MIRNGECLYRVYTENILIEPRLFPKRKELMELLATAEAKIAEDHFERTRQETKDQVEDMFYQYRKRAVLMQGLIDRSDVFLPLATTVSIFKLDECEGAVNFIYDDEDALPSGRMGFWDWVTKLNAGIEEGTRVLITGAYNTGRGWHSKSDYFDRFYNRQREHNTPALPTAGVYTVEEFASSSIMKWRKWQWDELQNKYPSLENEHGYIYKLQKIKKNAFRYGYVNGKISDQYGIGDCDCYYIVSTKKQKDLTIKYNPKDIVYHEWDGYRSNKRKYDLRFQITREDSFVLNYDQIDLDDVNFYLNSRVDRPNYLGMMPVLLKIKEQRLKEIANEKEFIRFIVGRVAPQLDDNKGEALKRTLECIRWWKYKNKWKRPITSDDTLALRMIERRLQSPSYGTFKHYNNKE